MPYEFGDYPVPATFAPGTASSGTFLRGDGTWATPPGGGVVSLRYIAPGTTTVPRAPASVATPVNFAYGTYVSLTPTTDTQFYGLSDVYQIAGGKFILKVFRVSDMALMATSPEGTVSGTAFVLQLAAPVTLLAGVAYMIGMYSTNTIYYQTTTTLTSWAGFTAGDRRYASNGNTGYPDTVFTGAQYTVWDILLAGGGGVAKGTTNALDPIDFPIVTTTAALPANSAAILDTGAGSIRLFRKRADSSLAELTANATSRAVSSVTANITLTSSAGDQVIFVSAAGGAVSVALPAAALAQGRITVKKTDTTSNAVTVTGSIEGAASVVLATPGHVLDLQSDVSTWQVV